MTNFVREEMIDQEVFIMITKYDMSESDVDAYFDKNLENRKTPVKIAASIALFLVCATILLFLFIGV